MSSRARELGEFQVAFNSVSVDTTMDIPSPNSIEVLEYTAATGTITLPDMSAQPGGSRFRILKNNATQGSVNINLSGTNVGIWGAVQLKLNADGDFWELQWTGSRFVLTDGFERGNNSNGEWLKHGDGIQKCYYVGRPNLATLSYTNDYPIPFIAEPFEFHGSTIKTSSDMRNVRIVTPSNGHNGSGGMTAIQWDVVIKAAADSGTTADTNDPYDRDVKIKATGYWYE